MSRKELFRFKIHSFAKVNKIKRMEFRCNFINFPSSKLWLFTLQVYTPTQREGSAKEKAINKREFERDNGWTLALEREAAGVQKLVKFEDQEQFFRSSLSKILSNFTPFASGIFPSPHFNSSFILKRDSSSSSIFPGTKGRHQGGHQPFLSLPAWIFNQSFLFNGINGRNFCINGK